MRKTNTKPKGKRSNYSGKRAKDEQVRDYRSKGRKPMYTEVSNNESGVVNDASYYVDESSTVLTDQLYTYSFTDYLGVKSELGTINGNQQGYYNAAIMQIMVNPSVTYTDRISPGSDGININGLKTFTILASESGRINNYQPSDVNLAILAVGNVLAEFSVGARALGLVGTYNQRNRTFPVGAVRACGFDLDEIKLNLANYRAQYNYLVQKFNKVPMFRSIKYLEKCSKMFSGIYLDMTNSSLAQAYAMMPTTQWILDESSNPNGSILKTIHNPSFIISNDFCHWSTYAAYLLNLEAMIDALLSSTTLNLVYADISRVAMKQGYELLKLDEVPTNYAIYPTVVEEIAEWLNSAIIINEPELTPNSALTTSFTTDNDVESDANTGMIKYNPCWSYGIDRGGFKPFLNFRVENPDLASRIYATRFYHLVDESEAYTSGGNTLYAPKRVTLTDWYITRIIISDGVFAGLPHTTPYTYNVRLSYDQKLANDFSKFDWHPLFYAVDTTGPTYDEVNILGDLQWYTTLPFDKVKAMDDVAMLNLMKLR